MTNENRRNTFPIWRLPVLALALLAVMLAALSEAQPARAADIDICDRTPEVIDAIRKEYAGSFTCSEVNDNHLSSVEFLGIRNYQKATIDPADFEGLTGVKRLDIDYSPVLRVIPEAAFAELTALSQLRLEGNRIRVIELGAFGGLSGLVDLDLSYNEIRTLPAGLFETDTASTTTNLAALDQLVLSGNRISSIPNDMFAGLSGLQKVYLDHNELSSIDNEYAFRGLTTLTVLDLKNNRLESLGAGVFAQLPGLERLDLDYNRLGAFPMGALSGNSSLATLNLSDNGIGALPGDLSSTLGGLRVLNVYDNEISRVTRAHFSGLSLRELGLRGNPLGSVPADLFADQSGLQSISLDKTELTSVPAGLFDGLSSLTYLSMIENELTDLDEDLFHDVTSLGDLHLASNRLTGVHENLFDGLTSLRTLVLSDNRITSLHEDVFDGLVELSILWLNGNELTGLHANLFDGLVYLADVSLNDNQIASLDKDVFDPLERIAILNLDGNQLREFPDGLFASTTALYQLNANDNRIFRLNEHVFASTTDLGWLELRGNRLSTLPQDTFASSTALTYLDLSCNRLPNFDANRLEGPKDSLEYFDLAGNPLGDRAGVQTAAEAKLTVARIISTADDDDCVGLLHSGLRGAWTTRGTVERSIDEQGEAIYTVRVPAGVDEVTITAGARREGMTVVSPRRPAPSRLDGGGPGPGETQYYDADLDQLGIQVSLRDAGHHMVPVALQYSNGDVYEEDEIPSLIVHREAPPRRAPCDPGPVSLDTYVSDRSLIPGLVRFDGLTHEWPILTWAAPAKRHCVARTEIWREDGQYERQRLVKSWNGSPRGANDRLEGGWRDTDSYIGHVFQYTIRRFGSDESSFSEATTQWIPIVPFYLDLDKSWRNAERSDGSLIPANDVVYHMRMQIGGPNNGEVVFEAPTVDKDAFFRGIGLYTWRIKRFKYPHVILDEDVDAMDPVSINAVAYHHPPPPATSTPPMSTTTPPMSTTTATTTPDRIVGSRDQYRRLKRMFEASNDTIGTDDPADRFTMLCARLDYTNTTTLKNRRIYDGCAAFDVHAARHITQEDRPGSPAPRDPPGAPENLEATAGADGIALTWDASAGAESYSVHRRLQDLATYTEVGTSTTNSYTDTSAEVAVGYAYKVQATNEAGDSEYSEHVLAMIEPPAPDAPTGFAADVGEDSVTLSWDASDDDTITGYILTRQVRDADPPAQPTLVRVNGVTTQATDSRPEAGAAYTYSITAINAGGRSEAATVDVDIPEDTGGLTVTRSGLTFNLSWDEVEDATGYNVLRMGPDETEHSRVATTTANSYSDTPVGSGTFSYRIQPVEDGEAGDAYAAVTVEMPPPPDPPTNLQATAASSSVTLTWTAPGETLAGYFVYRKVRDADPPEDFAFHNTADPEATSYTDATVEADTAYAYYVVAARSALELSEPSATVEVDTPAESPFTGFTLVDASDQAVLATLTGGDSVELADPSGGSYGIRADLAAGETAGSVRLELSGAKTVSRTENVTPYSLYGDGGANALRGQSLPAGSYTLTATAYSERNRGGDELGTLDVSFTVAQTNRAPEFGSASYSFSIAEDAATSTAVGSVSATDADSDGLTYTIESGNGGGAFAIDGNSGAITTATALDHGTTPSYALTVQADDGNGGTATATVNVTVTEVVELGAGPLTGFTLVDASDQTVLATLTGGTSVELADPSGGSYGIRADVDSNVTIGSLRLELSGAKSVTRTENTAPYSLYGDGGANALWGQTLPAGSYTLTATAYSESGLAGDVLGTLGVSFTVTAPSETNNTPQFGSASYSFSIAEDAATGAAVGTVSATDADSDGLTYTIEAGNGDGKFAIDGSSGAITTAGALDHETTPSYTLTVQANDNNGGTVTATVNVNVTDVVEDPDATRAGAVSLGDQSPDRGRQFFYDKSLDRANGDTVDYYTFTTDGRYTLGLGARDQTVELKVTLEDADGNVEGTAGPPADPNKDQVYIEWLKVTIDAGTYYIRVEALADGQTDYYIRFGLETP